MEDSIENEFLKRMKRLEMDPNENNINLLIQNCQCEMCIHKNNEPSGWILWIYWYFRKIELSICFANNLNECLKSNYFRDNKTKISCTPFKTLLDTRMNLKLDELSQDY